MIDFATETTAIDGLLLITMKQIPDDRGTIRELYRGSALPGVGPWVQVNVTETVRGAVRGMHGEDMTKLVAVVTGAAFCAWVDLRSESPTFGEVVTAELVPGMQALVPPRVGNGFQATASGVTQYVYCFDREWAPDMPGAACNPLDPALGIEWPLPIAAISAKDRDAPLLSEVPT
jgi:dTDP-4-dehydrorhamnose 3,5-epimerase